MKKAKAARPLQAAKLRWRCVPRSLGFRTTADVACCNEIIGQARAIAAMRLGLEFQSPGYNVFVAGLTGTGKSTAIKRLLDEMHLPGGAPLDFCYVHNFRQPDAPIALQLPAGRGRELRREMQELIELLRRALPSLYDSDPYKQARRALEADFQARVRKSLATFERRVAAAGFRIVQLQMGPLTRTEIYPVVNGKPVAFEELQAQAAGKSSQTKKLASLQQKHAQLVGELEGVLRAGRGVERELRAAVQTLDREYARQLLRDPLQDLRESFAKLPRVLDFFAAVEAHVLDSLPQFIGTSPAGGEAAAASEMAPASETAPGTFEAFDVNVVVDNTGARRPPVLIETAPSMKSLFGNVERVVDRSGVWRSDHMSIRAGSLLRANGGYLVLNLLDFAPEPAVWPMLKRVLKNMRAEIPSFEPLTGFLGAGVKPEPVDLKLKVILLGDAFSYQVLYDHDDEFRKIFKVKSDFDSTMPRTRAALREYAEFIAALCQNEGLLPFDASGVAAVIEAGVRLAGRQTKLSTRFSDIADVVREAHYWARKGAHRIVREAQVDRAVRERIERVNLVETKIQEAYENGQMLLDVRGKRVGQVNALTVYDFGDHVFGRPARITSQVSLGRTGIINIEREANLSGATHDKGVLILAGYLRSMYAQDKPLTLSASLAFEQSYGGVEGDSATAAEVFVLLSAIANLPLRQDIAVTGSVDQKGQLQPVGGVNEKIEGFYDVCKARGLTGTQGVLIPALNAAELMLRKDVVAAVRRRQFHIYALRNIDEGLELMTGFKAGRRRRYRFEADTVHRRVDNALFELAEAIKEFVDGSDTPAGRPPAAGLADEESEGGIDVRPRRGPAVRHRRRGRP